MLFFSGAFSDDHGLNVIAVPILQKPDGVDGRAELMEAADVAGIEKRKGTRESLLLGERVFAFGPWRDKRSVLPV